MTSIGEGTAGGGAGRGLLLHALAIALILAFVNAFGLWRLTGEVLGEQIRDAGPFIVMAAVVAGLGVLLAWRRDRQGVSWPWLLAGAGLAAAGFLVADPLIPAKRIHVPEYMLLSGVVAAALGPRVRGTGAAILVLVITAFYGVHDELLQGFHPSRTFGLRDIAVNALGAGAGVCVLQALRVRRQASFRGTNIAYLPVPVAAGLALCIVTVALTVVVLPGYRHDTLPLWSVAPVLASAVAFSFVACSHRTVPGLGLVVVQLIALAVYPVMSRVASLDFA